ncbi:Dcp1p-Dcp2p decapping enzyme complex alpha subunit, partial [Mortierella antarctica]
MLLSTHTPKGPACFLIDRHYDITFVPQLLLPMRDNPSKYQNETLLDGEMILDQDGAKKTLRFLVFDLTVLNGTVVTQRSYSTRLGMMDQDILGVQASKPSDVISKEPFTIERKTMQRSYGLNIILSGSKKHKHGGEGLIFVPVKQPYVPGTSPKLLKWKSHTTAQFQIKVTQSRERKPLYCIHVKQGSGSKFYDYVTPEPALASEWDAQWPTQMFEKGYGLETRTGGWRFFRVREDKKDVDDETTVQALVKSLEAPVTKAQLESSIDQIRSQWKAREAGVSSNGSSTSLLPSSSHSAPRPPVRPLTINSTTTSHADAQPPLLTPALSSHYLQSPSMASQSSSSYFSRKDRERKSSMDEHGSLSPHTSTLSHPLPPKPSFQPRKSSMDQAQTHSSTPGNTDDTAASTEADQSSTPLPTSSGVPPLQKNEIKASTPPPMSPATPSSSTSTAPVVTGASSITSASPTSTAASSSLPSLSVVKNPLKLPQVQAHLQPIKPWMTTAPVPRAPSVEKAGKTNKLERRGSKDVIGGSGDPLARPGPPSTRKSSLNIVDTVKEVTSTIPRPSSSPKSMEQAEASKPANSSGSSSTSGTVATSAALEAKPQTPTPAHTPTPAGMLPMNGAALPPSSMSNPLPAIALPNTLHESKETESAPENTSTDIENRGKNVSTTSSADDPLAPTTRPQAAGEDYSDLSSPVLGKRALALSSAGGDPSDDTIAQRRKLSEVLHSPKVEPAMAENDALPVTTLQSSKPQVGSPLAIGDRERPASKPLPLSPLSSPDFRAVNGAERQTEIHPRAAGASNPTQANDRPNEAASYDDMVIEPKQEESTPKQPVSGSGYARQDVEMEDATRPVVKCEPAWNEQEKENNPLISSSSPATVVTEQARKEVAAAVAGGTLPVVALSTTEQMAYGPPSSQERMLAMAKARAVAASKLNHQRQEQAIKERKLREDTDKFRERSRIRKEKAQEHKTQEVNETPQVQDRRAQPVRQINQQQGRQSNQETSGVRGQNQGVQRTASPQDQQRIPYSTRQSRAGSRLDAQLSAQNSPKGQARAMQTSANQKGQDSSMGEPTTRLQALGGDAFPNRSEPTSPSESRSEQSTAVPSDQRMLHPGDVPRHHRRISSMDHSFAHVQSPKQTGSVPAAANQRDMTDMEYGQPFIKRLDVGQLGEPSHRRSHSDVGVAYKPVVTAIVEPQPIARDHLTTDMAGDPSQQNPIMTRIADDGRQGIHPSQSPYSQTQQRYSMNGSEMSGNSRPSSRTGEATRATRESKARLQFILNDDPPSPEGHQANDLPERRPSSDGPAWNPHNSESEAVPRGGTAAVPSAGYVRQQYPSEYGQADYQEAQMPPKTTAGPGVTGTSLRRQPTKKQKLSQDVVVHDIPYGGRVDQYEYHMRQSQIQNLPSRTGAQAPPRPAYQADRWPPHPPHPSGQQGIQGQAQPNASHLQSSSRRMPGHEILVSTAPQQQQAPHPLNRQMYPGQEAAQLGRAVHPDHPYPPTSHLPMQESPRPPERPSHSRHSSMSKSGMVQEPIQPPPSQSYPGPRKTQQPHGQVTPPEQYTRGYPPPQAAQGPGPSRAAPQQQQQQPSYQYQQQQQQQQAAATPPSRRKTEQHASSYAPSSTSGGPAGYEQQRPGQPQHPHSQQQQHHQHSLANRHHEQEHMRDPDADPGMHPKHGHPQFRSGHHEGGAAPAGQGYYEQEVHPSNFGPGRGPMYGSQSLQPSPAYDRQYPPYHPSEATHDPAYRFAGHGKRPSAGGEHPAKEEHGRPGHVGRPSIGQMPGDHPSQQQGQQHGQFHPAQRPHQQHPSHLQQQDYRAGPSPYHYQQPPPQHSSQQKLVHMQEHAQYSGAHHPGPPNVSSPRPGQPVGVHPSELDPNYRQQAPHSHGGGGPP